MFDMISKTTMMVSDFKTYYDQFPIRDPTCLVSAAFSHKDVQAMHTEDAVDDADLAAQPAPPLTRFRSQSLPVHLPAAPSVPTAVPIPTLPNPPPPVSIFNQPFSSMTESQLAAAFLNNNVAFVLPSQYCPPDFPPPETDMIVISTRVQRLSKLKSALWVRFLSPPSYKDKKLQLYPRSLEPHKGPGQGQDFSLLSTLGIQYPSALTLNDIGITERTRAATTAALLQDLPTCHVVYVYENRLVCTDLSLCSIQGHSRSRTFFFHRQKVKKKRKQFDKFYLRISPFFYSAENKL
jgi:hypothetical protein